MSYTPSLGPEGWQPEQPMVISRGEYKLWDDDFIYLGQPLEIDTARGTSGVDTTDDNKRWVQPYTSATGVNKCVGISMVNRLAKNNANSWRAGLGGFRRDLRLFQFGLIQMLNVSGATINFGDEVMAMYNSSASVSGIAQKTAAGYKIGTVFQEEIPDGKFGLVFINLIGKSLRYMVETGITVTTHVGPLTYAPIANMPMFAEATTATTAGPKLVGFANSTPAAGTAYADPAVPDIQFNATDDVSVATVGYWYLG